MRRGIRLLAVAAIGITMLPFSGAHADEVSTGFEPPEFALGTIHNQNGWKSSGSAGSGCAAYDHKVVDNTGAAYSYDGFGDQSLRISNAVTSGCFGDHTFSASAANDAGETDALTGGLSGGTRRNEFQATWTFASTTPDAHQPGLSVVASPDRGDGARMSWIQMADLPGGIDINFYDYQSGAVENGCATGANFVFSNIATGLDRAVPHTIGVEMDLPDGPGNDVVRVYVDGSLAHTGTSWEGYFRECEGTPQSRSVDSILFRTGGTAAPATLGKGWLIDQFGVTTLNRTSLTANPILARVPEGDVYVTEISATLTDKDGPIEGETVEFRALAGQDEPLCTAVTGADGVASCAITDVAVGLVLNSGYQAFFRATDLYGASTDTASWLEVAGQKIFP